MAKTKEELNEIKEEFENLNKKLNELSEMELNQVIGGAHSMMKENEEGQYVMFVKSMPIPQPVPIRPIVSKKCQYKPCKYASKSQCPYYSEDIGDCIY